MQTNKYSLQTKGMVVNIYKVQITLRGLAFFLYKKIIYCTLRNLLLK